MKRLAIAAITLAFVLSLPPVWAQSLDLDINKETFLPGDRANVTAEVINPNNYTLTLRSILTTSSEEDFAPRTTVIAINRSERVGKNLHSLKISDDLPQGDYEVDVDLLQRGNVIASKSLAFKVVGTKRDFECEVKVYQGEKTTELKKIFLPEATIYLDYESDVTGLSLDSQLTYPNRTTFSVSLPASVVSKQLGTYTLETEASKQGYKTARDSIQFAVINESADIKPEKPKIPGLKAEVCSDRNCDQEIESIEKDKSVWLDFSADLTDISLSSQLVYPQGTSREVELPQQISLDRAGDYELEVTGFKQGYRKTIDSHLFVVKRSGNVPGGKEKTGGVFSQVLEYAPYLILIIALLISIIIYFSLVSQKK